MRKIEYIVEPDCDGYRVGNYLKFVKGVSTRIIKDLKKTEIGLQLNGQHTRSVDLIKAGDLVTICIEDNPKDYILSDIAVELLYEDEDVIAFNKPANMPCHQSKRHQSETLGNVFAMHCNKTGQALSYRPINRLDKDTSGIVVVAKNAFTACALNGSIDKRYYAIVCGVVPKDSDIIEAPIARLDEMGIPKTGIRRMVSPEGQYAKTEYTVLARGEKYTFMQFKLYTGRTHQIRVHMAEIGYPLAGDTLYGGDTEIIPRQALHCAWVSFTHPITKETVEISSSLGKDMQKALEIGVKTV